MITLNDVLANLADTIIVKDKQGTIIYNNKNYDLFSDIVENNITGEVYREKSRTWFNVIGKSIVVGDSKYALVQIKDITKYKKREQILYDKTMCDELTGLFNRKGILCGLDKSIENFDKHNKPFTVIIGDIDSFKQINDTYGHPAGDEILSKVGIILERNIRENDFVGRYGGEEFLIILASNNSSQIKQRIEQIRKAIETHNFVHKGININLTMTFGIQMYDGSKHIEEVIEQADKALYYGKEHGRNQIILYKDVENELNQNPKKM